MSKCKAQPQQGAIREIVIRELDDSGQTRETEILGPQDVVGTSGDR